MSDEAVLRADHVQLCYTYTGRPMNIGRAEQGWLVLTSQGTVKFFKLGTSVTQLPTFVAPSIRDFTVKVRNTYAQGKFGTTKRFVTFTGFTRPSGESASGDATKGAGMLLGNETLGQIGDAAGLVSQASVFIKNKGWHARQREAREAWFSVMRGDRPWANIARNDNAGE